MKLSNPASLIAAVIVCLFGAAVQAQDHEARQAKSSSVRLGNKTILIPDPEGFQEATSQFESFKARVEATEAPQNDALLSHLPVSDCELIRKGLNATYNHYTKVSVLKVARELTASRALLAEAVDDFRKNVGTFLDPNGEAMKKFERHVEQGLSRLDSRETKVDFSKPQLLGEFDVRPDVNSFLILMAFTINSGGSERTVPVLATTTFVRVRERIIFVYVYKKYESNADMDTIKRFTTKWTTSIVAANREP